MVKEAKLQIPVASVFEPLLAPMRYKGAYGGRGSGKSWFFAGNLIDDSINYPGLRSVCIREVQKSLKESAKRLIEDKIEGLGVGHLFDVKSDEIRTPGGGIIIFQGMQDHTKESIKSLEGFDRAWIEEAQTLSAESFEMLRPTIRKEGSELWASWNPRRPVDPIDEFFRVNPPGESAVVKANWSDNPWFPDVLELERQLDKEKNPDRYDHVWEGGYATVTKGAYYAVSLSDARREGRIGRVTRHPHMALKAFCDIGGSGSRSDAFAIWIGQFVGREIRVLDHYEAQGQPLESHINWLRDKGYVPGRCEIYLPHDGATQDRVCAVSFQSAFRNIGYKVTVIPNQGRGAAKARIEAGRKLFPAMYFNEETTKAGIEALGWYHEKQDPNRQMGLGPEHDWASHSADSFGLMCVAYKPPRSTGTRPRIPLSKPRDRVVGY